MFGGKICWCFEFLTCDNIRISCASSPTIYRYQVFADVVAGNPSELNLNNEVTFMLMFLVTGCFVLKSENVAEPSEDLISASIKKEQKCMKNHQSTEYSSSPKVRRC